MNFDQLVAELRRLRLDSIESSLLRAVDDERTALLKVQRGRRTARAVQEADRAARDFYADEICMYLADPQPLTPGAVLAHRRLPTAWAIASFLRDGRAAEAKRAEAERQGRDAYTIHVAQFNARWRG